MSASDTYKSDYQKLWELLRDSPVGKEVKVTVHINHRDTLIQALARTKCAENVTRKALSMPSFGKTKVVRYRRENRNDPMCVVGFTLTYSLEQLL